MKSSRNLDWEKLCIQTALHGVINWFSSVWGVFMLSNDLIHSLCLVLKMVAKGFSSILNHIFSQSFSVLWTPLPASRPLHLHVVHHPVPCAPGTVVSNSLINLTLLKERENLLRDLIIFNLQRMNLICLEEYFISELLYLVLLGFSSFGEKEDRERAKELRK